MATDWESEGLLEGTEDEAAHAARVKLLEHLENDGVALDELREAVAEDRLALMPVERSLSRGANLTPDEVAEQSGLDVAFLRELWVAGGQTPLGESHDRFTDTDVETARLAAEFLGAGVGREALLEFVRVLGTSMARIAQASNSAVASAVIRDQEDEYDLAMRFVAMAEDFIPRLAPLLLRAMEIQTREGLRNAIVGRAELDSHRATGVRLMTIGFADLVGFTRLGEEIPADELGNVARRLVSLTQEATEPPVRLLKTIGDAVMLVSTETAPLVDTMLTLVERAEDEGNGFPQLRAGAACGEALSRSGDWYGRPVNLASRITSAARPGSVLVSAAVKDTIEDDARYRFSFAGKRRLKGISEETELHRVRFQSDENAS